jgi:hypothetical protein
MDREATESATDGGKLPEERTGLDLYTIMPSVQPHRLLPESPLSPCFRVNTATCFGHTGPLSGICDESSKLLHYSIALCSP